MFNFNTPITKDTTLVGDYNCKPPIDPNNPTFANLKLALQTDDPASYYPLGKKFPDTYTYNNTVYNFTWRIAHYGKATNSAGKQVDGVYLFMNALPPRMDTGSHGGFWGSNLQTALQPNGSIYNCFSSDIKSYTIDIQRDYKVGTGNITTPTYIAVTHTSKFGAIGAVECNLSPTFAPMVGSQFVFDFFKSNATTYRTLWEINSSQPNTWCTRDVFQHYTYDGGLIAITLFSVSSSGEMLAYNKGVDIAKGAIATCGITVFIPK